ncbi:MAG: Bcr/CflA family drug resistance efflux transporter [Rhodobacteraceae bacterium]|nr:Bcr/CflA family drug resistance efflux transporter [Paracoccaceae bacterium]
MTLADPAPPRPARILDRSTPPAIITLVVMAGLGALSMNIFLPSMPGMAAYFEVEYAVMQLAISAYLTVMAAVQLLIGPLSDRYGRRPVVLGAFAIFTVATLGCILAPTIEIFMACRMAQAGVSAGLVLSRAMVRDMVGPEKSASMIGYVTMCMAVAPMIGPMIGGALEQAWGWHANFIVLLVFGLAATALCWADAGETNRHRSASFTEQFRAYPELFASRRFWGYALACAFASGAFFTFMGGAPYVATEMLGLSPSELGFYFGFIAGGYMSGNFLSGRYSQRVGLNRMILTGTLVSTCAMLGCLVMFLAGLAHPLALFGPVFVMGMGNGMTMPNAMAGSLSVRPQLAGSASGLGSTLMMGGGAALSAATGALLGPETGPWPLIGMMLLTGVLSTLSILYVMAVERRRLREEIAVAREAEARARHVGEARPQSMPCMQDLRGR